MTKNCFTLRFLATLLMLAAIGAWACASAAQDANGNAACAAPKFMYFEGKVSIMTETEGAEIHFTMDRTAPTAQSPLYTEPVQMAKTDPLWAIAILGDCVSEVSEYEFGAFQGLASLESRPQDSEIKKNHIANGDFEDTNFQNTEEPPFSWIPGVFQTVEVPGWTLVNYSIYNGVFMLKEYEDSVQEDNQQYLQAWHYPDNGWAPMRAYQKISELEVGRTYRLDLLKAVHYDERYFAWKGNGVAIYDKPRPGEEKGEVVYQAEDMLNDSTFRYFAYDFVATNDEMVVELWATRIVGECETGGTHWVNWDNARVYQIYTLDQNPNTSGIADAKSDGQLRVKSNGHALIIYADEAQRTAIYNVAGRMVRSVELSVGENIVEGLAPGVYFVNGAKAAILR